MHMDHGLQLEIAPQEVVHGCPEAVGLFRGAHVDVGAGREVENHLVMIAIYQRWRCCSGE
jgi:hypothetical protein